MRTPTVEKRVQNYKLSRKYTSKWRKIIYFFAEWLNCSTFAQPKNQDSRIKMLEAGRKNVELWHSHLTNN